jgi:hypothetical protein
MVSHLRNIDEALAATVADGLALPELPAPAQAARPTIADLPPSDALSIVKNGPPSFKGRKLGILLSDGADPALFNALVKAIDNTGGGTAAATDWTLTATGPTNLSGQVRLTWLAPTSNGGSAVTDYIVQRSPNGTTGWATITDGVNTATTYGYDSVTMMQETKTTLCQVAKA